jgi:exopolyphosphatase/guanosine-5'-triphosphate,3'-diphosphate pyrophosphatase
MGGEQYPPAKNIAAVDLGSNSFHLKIVAVFNNELKVVDRLRESVQLAAGLDGRQRLDADARQRAIDCLTRFGERLRGVPPGNIRAVGTNTLRKARNSAGLIADLEQALGHSIEIISGIEEARLIYLGVAHSVAADDHRRLVMDIGGGSTEYIIGEGFEPLRVESLYMGCISMTRQFFADGSVSRKAWRRAVLAAQMELEPIEAEYRELGWEVAIGASGSIRGIAKLVNNMQQGDVITAEVLAELAEKLISAGQVDKLDCAQGVSAERMRTIAGGLAVLYGTFQSLGIEAMQISDGALREGLLYNQLKRIRHEDIRGRSIKALATHYRVDAHQARRVSDTVLLLLEQVASDWHLNDDSWTELLGWAAQVYEIGIAIAHSQHQKHAAYILENADLAGFSRQEQKQLAILVRSHRRKFPQAVFRDLPAAQIKPLQRLAILLRLGALLHRSRRPDALPEITIKVQKKQIRLQFPAGWLDSHALTQADLQQEADYLRTADYTLEIG